MRKRTRKFIWGFLIGWFLVLLMAHEANSQEKGKPTEAPLTASEEKSILDISDAAQVAGKAYVVKQQAYLGFVKDLAARKHYPEGTTFKVDFDPAKCVPLPDGMMKCQRKVVPVFPVEKANIPAEPAATEKK